MAEASTSTAGEGHPQDTDKDVSIGGKDITEGKRDLQIIQMIVSSKRQLLDKLAGLVTLIREKSFTAWRIKLSLVSEFHEQKDRLITLKLKLNEYRLLVIEREKQQVSELSGGRLESQFNRELRHWLSMRRELLYETQNLRDAKVSHAGDLATRIKLHDEFERSSLDRSDKPLTALKRLQSVEAVLADELTSIPKSDGEDFSRASRCAILFHLEQLVCLQRMWVWNLQLILSSEDLTVAPEKQEGLVKELSKVVDAQNELIKSLKQALDGAEKPGRQFEVSAVWSDSPKELTELISEQIMLVEASPAKDCTGELQRLDLMLEEMACINVRWEAIFDHHRLMWRSGRLLQLQKLEESVEMLRQQFCALGLNHPDIYGFLPEDIALSLEEDILLKEMTFWNEVPRYLLLGDVPKAGKEGGPVPSGVWLESATVSRDSGGGRPDQDETGLLVFPHRSRQGFPPRQSPFREDDDDFGPLVAQGPSQRDVSAIHGTDQDDPVGRKPWHRELWGFPPRQSPFREDDDDFGPLVAQGPSQRDVSAIHGTDQDDPVGRKPWHRELWGFPPRQSPFREDDDDFGPLVAQGPSQRDVSAIHGTDQDDPVGRKPWHRELWGFPPRQSPFREDDDDFGPLVAQSASQRDVSAIHGTDQDDPMGRKPWHSELWGFPPRQSPFREDDDDFGPLVAQGPSQRDVSAIHGTDQDDPVGRKPWHRELWPYKPIPDVFPLDGSSSSGSSSPERSPSETRESQTGDASAQPTHLQRMLLEHEKLTAGLTDSELLENTFQLSYFAISHFNERGGSLSLKEYNIHLYIPCGALSSRSLQKVYLYVNPDAPPVEGLEGQGVALSPMIQCGPTGLQFLDRVVLSFPHHATERAGCDLSARICRNEEDALKEWRALDRERDGILVSTKDQKAVLLMSHFCGTVLTSQDPSVAKKLKVGVFGAALDPSEDWYAVRIYTWNDDEVCKQKVIDTEADSDSKKLDGPQNLEVDLNQGDVKVEIEKISEGWQAEDTQLQTISKSRLWKHCINSVTLDFERQAPSEKKLRCESYTYQIGPPEVGSTWTGDKVRLVFRAKSAKSGKPDGNETRTAPSGDSRSQCGKLDGAKVKKEPGMMYGDYGGLSPSSLQEVKKRQEEGQAGCGTLEQLTEILVGTQLIAAVPIMDVLKLYFSNQRASPVSDGDAVRRLRKILKEMYRGLELPEEVVESDSKQQKRDSRSLSEDEVQLGISEQKWLRKLAKQLGEEWEELATNLEITKAELYRIKTDNQGNVGNQMYAMLELWGRKGRPVSELIQALRDVGRHDLAEQQQQQQQEQNGRKKLRAAYSSEVPGPAPISSCSAFEGGGCAVTGV